MMMSHTLKKKKNVPTNTFVGVAPGGTAMGCMQPWTGEGQQNEAGWLPLLD